MVTFKGGGRIFVPFDANISVVSIEDEMKNFLS